MNGNTQLRLECWSFQTLALNDFYTPPELLIPVLHGNVHGHPNHENGKVVTTSRVIGRVGELVQTQSGSLYELGAVDPVYEGKFPNARIRLLQTLKEQAK